MTKRFCLPLATLVLAMPASLAAQGVQDFQLPPAPTPTPSPNVQGPVDTEGASVPRRPRAIPTARPSTTPTPAPTATQSPAPRITPEPLTGSTPRPTQAVRPTPTPSVRATTAPAPGEIAPSPEVSAQPETPAASTQFPGIEPIAPPADAGAETVEEQAGLPWTWIGGGAGLLVLLGGLFFLWRRRAANAAPPEIARPVVVKPTVNAPAAPAMADIQIRAEAIRLTRSFANATLDYRVTLINRSTSALSNVKLSADLISAHGDLPAEQQVATPASMLDQRHAFDRIAPGQSVRHEGKLILSLAQAKIIHQGPMALLVPLLRIRVDGAGDAPQVKTFVIGQGVEDGGRVAPFRLDEGLRSWSPVAARALD